MKMKENLIPHISSNDTNVEEQLIAALELIKNYEDIIADLRNTNSNNLKKFTHDLSSPLQVLSMTVESLEDRMPPEFSSSFGRITQAADTMVEIIGEIRKLRQGSVSSEKSIRVV